MDYPQNIGHVEDDGIIVIRQSLGLERCDAFGIIHLIAFLDLDILICDDVINR